MSVIDIWCITCAAVRPHAANEDLMACTGCGQIRHGLGEGLAVAALTVAEMPPVDDMRDCRWCNEKKPADHDCPAGAVGCTAGRGDGTTCGECGPCLDAQRSDPRYGSLNDLDIP
jgi:hypothetical protein